MSFTHSFSAGLSTPLKLLILMTLALAPIGALLSWSAAKETNEARTALQGQADGDMLAAARETEALIARNALALRIAANGAFASDGDDPCFTARQSLEITPALANRFSLQPNDGDRLCGELDLNGAMPTDQVRAGGIEVWVDPNANGLLLRVGVAGGTATSLLTVDEIREAALQSSRNVDAMQLSDSRGGVLDVVTRENRTASNAIERRSTLELAGKRLDARMATDIARISVTDRLLIFLPVLMFAAAVLLAWFLVHRLLIRPLGRLRGAIARFDPDEDEFALPDRLGPATEIKELGGAFVSAMHRVEESEKVMADALEGQRKLVREVHHRVKNNLQVIASLLNIHSRGAEGEEAQAAYAGIGRRVEALSVVHRNHFAEVEESRGIALRPLITELAASLRASASEPGSGPIDLDLSTASTTQDVAVAAAFLITEIVEFVLMHGRGDPIEISLRQTSEITAQLSIANEALVERDNPPPGFAQFDRIVEGLARQLRSPLEKRVGRYAVELPIFSEE